jgi:hypothetical protein
MVKVEGSSSTKDCFVLDILPLSTGETILGRFQAFFWKKFNLQKKWK